MRPPKRRNRTFPAGHPEVPHAYRDVGQPVLIPGDMGRYSFLLVGQPAAMDETFGSVCHGAGRAMSRHQARKTVSGEQVRADLAAKGIVARSKSWKGLAEEYSGAYKDVADVVDVVERGPCAKGVPHAAARRHQRLTRRTSESKLKPGGRVTCVKQMRHRQILGLKRTARSARRALHASSLVDLVERDEQFRAAARARKRHKNVRVPLHLEPPCRTSFPCIIQCGVAKR